MKTVAIVQARMSSERMPGKVLKPLGATPVLAHVIARLRRVPTLNDVMIATSDRADDDVVADFATAQDCRVFRGSLDDVLARFVGAARAAQADVVVRITGDCPLICPEVIDAMVARYSAGEGPSVVTNARVRTFPRGLDAEVFPRAALEAAERAARKPHQREHVTPYFYEHPELFAIVDHTQARDVAAARWTLDTIEDYRMLRAFFTLLADADAASLGDLLGVWDTHPELHAINAEVVQRHYAARPAG